MMNFSSIKEIYEYLVNTGDLYDKATQTYIFVYNDANALCIYSMSPEDMLVAARKVISQHETHISGVLGVGGTILDDSEYDQFRYVEDKRERALYLKPSIDFCMQLRDSEYTDLVPAEEFITLAQIEIVEELHINASDGVIYDADTILADAVAQCDCKITGFAQDIFNIWKNSSDKQAVEQMFYEFTNREFKDYLEDCQKLISKENNPNKYKGYLLETSGNVKYLFKARPYDEAEYYSARTFDEKNWTITKGGRRMSERMCDFHTIVDIVESLNSSIKPRMCHN